MFLQLQPTNQLFCKSPVAIYCANFSLAEYNDALFSQLNIYCPDNIRKAVTKRKAEYLAGRYLANLALEQKGIHNFNLVSDSSRRPLWPEGITGSISHTRNIAFCALSEDSSMTGLGIDVEFWVKKQSETLIQKNIIDNAEKETINNTDMPFNQAFTLIFSAKESLFKALYPQIKSYFGFKAAKLTRIDLKRQTIHFKLNEDLSSKFTKNTSFQISFVLNKEYALTLLTV